MYVLASALWDRVVGVFVTVYLSSEQVYRSALHCSCVVFRERGMSENHLLLQHNNTLSKEDEDKIKTTSFSNSNTEEDGDKSNSCLKEQVYTVEEAVEALGFGPFQVLVAVFSGMLWLADAMELMLLSVLSPAVQCQWELTNDEEALITSVVFVGFLLGGFFWGMVCDLIGRKKGLFCVDILILLFGILSAIPVSADDSKIPGYPWLLFCRSGVGFASAGAGQAVTYFAEFLPRKARGICIACIEIWWGIGSMFGAALAVGVMRPGGLGWHWYLGLAAIPLAFVLLLFPLIPESARYFVVKGKNGKAEKVIQRIAWMNFSTPPQGRIVSLEEKQRLEAGVPFEEPTETTIEDDKENKESDNKESDSLLKENDNLNNKRGKRSLPARILNAVLEQLKLTTLLFTNGMWKTTVLLLGIWFVDAWLYYGIVLLTTTLLQHDPHCGIYQHNDTNISCEDTQLDTGDYLKVLWTAAAELPGIVVTILIIEVIGRKLTMASEFLATMAGFLLLFICGGETLTTFFLFTIRAFATGVFQAVYVYTPEVYPTKVRGVALGVCTSSARIGAILTPYAAQVLLHKNEFATIGLYAGSAFVMIGASLLLPIETKGRSLADEGGT